MKRVLLKQVLLTGLVASLLCMNANATEVLIDRSKFSLVEFPGDYSTPNAGTQTVDLIWTNPGACFGDPGTAGSTRTYVSLLNGHSLPQWFSIDLGETYELTKMKLYPRGDDGANSNRFYAGGNLKEFEVWGALDPDICYDPDEHGGDFGEDWVLLKSYSVNRPSGNSKASATTRTGNTTEDIAVAMAGYELLFDYTGKVRYIRINIKENWHVTTQNANISSIVLWANENDTSTAKEINVSNDKIVEVRYYSLLGIEVSQPVENVPYIVKTVYESKKVEVSKRFFRQ